jgi:hypothetical protein
VSELRALHARLLQPSSDLDTAFFRDLGAVLDDRAAMLGLVRRALADPAYAGGANRGYVITSVADALGDTNLAIAALQNELQAQPGFAQGTMPQYAYVGLWNAPYSGLRARPEFKQLLIQAGVVDYWRQSGRWGDGCKPVGERDFSCQ